MNYIISTHQAVPSSIVLQCRVEESRGSLAHITDISVGGLAKQVHSGISSNSTIQFWSTSRFIGDYRAIKQAVVTTLQ